MKLENTAKYDDIIYLPHHVSRKHPSMPVKDRAAQFSPFSALTGHEAAIKETARLTREKIELDESRKSVLNEKLQMLLEQIGRKQAVSFVYFKPDEKKEGGSYVQITERMKKIDEYNQRIIMENGLVIPIDDIYDIEVI